MSQKEEEQSLRNGAAASLYGHLETATPVPANQSTKGNHRRSSTELLESYRVCSDLMQVLAEGVLQLERPAVQKKVFHESS
jgi:hypothetical protein